MCCRRQQTRVLAKCESGMLTTTPRITNKTPLFFSYNNGKTSSQWYYFPQQENYFPQQYSPQQALNQQQQQFYSPQQQYSSPSSTSFASHVHGVPQLQATAAGAGGQYGGNNNAISGSQTQQQLQTFGSSAQQQLTQFSGGQQQQQGHQAIPLDRNGVVNNQLGNNNQSPNVRL